MAEAASIGGENPTSTAISVTHVEKYLRRVKCVKKKTFDAWRGSKKLQEGERVRQLSGSVQNVLSGNAVAIRDVSGSIRVLAEGARSVLGTKQAPSNSEMASLSASSFKSKLNRRTRVRQEIRKLGVLPQWAVEAEAAAITDAWLMSLKGRYYSTTAWALAKGRMWVASRTKCQ